MDVIVPTPAASEGFVEVELAQADKRFQGHPWRKHILNLGDLIHPVTGQRIPLGDEFYDKLKTNFERGVCDIVAVPLANDKNQHTEAPLANAGEVVGISREGSKVYVDLDIRRDDVHTGLKNKTLLGTSAFLNLDYKDTRTGEKVGPALLHACITNRPYVTGLEPYEEIVAATVPSDTETDVVVLANAEPPEPTEPPEPEETVSLTKDELIAALRDEHGIDVVGLQAAASAPPAAPDPAELTAQLTAALAGTAILTNADGESLSLTDVVNAVAEVAQTNVALTRDVASLKQERAEAEVDGYIASGRVLPKQRKAFVELALTNREMLNEVLPAEPVVKLNHQEGGADPQDQAHQQDIDAEVARLTELSNSVRQK